MKKYKYRNRVLKENLMCTTISLREEYEELRLENEKLKETVIKLKESIKKAISKTCFGLSSFDPNVCSGNGKCIDQDMCICEFGWMGIQCEYFHVKQK